MSALASLIRYSLTSAVLCLLLAKGASAQTQGILWGFEENNGQWVNDSGQVDTVALYRLRAPGLEMYVYPNWVQYFILRYEEDTTATGVQLTSIDSLMFPFLAEPRTQGYWYPMSFCLKNANQPTAVNALDTFPGTCTYANAACGTNGISVRSYAKLVIQNVYLGIDWVMHYHTGVNSGVEFDFIVHPGADPGDIRLHYHGMDSMFVCQQHQLHVVCPLGNLLESRPFAYQPNTDSIGLPHTTIVQCEYEINADSAEVSYALLGGYDSTQVLVIDPVMSWSTYFGGAGSEEISQALWHNNHLYVCGTVSAPLNKTSGFDFPGVVMAVATPTAHKQGFDFFVARFSPENELEDLIIIGGQHDERFLPRIAVNGQGFVFLHGTTRSPDYPTGFATPSANIWAEDDHSEVAEQDLCLTILNPGLNNLVYSTCFGGQDQAYLNAIGKEAKQVIINEYNNLTYDEVHLGKTTADYAISIATVDVPVTVGGNPAIETHIYICGGTNSSVEEGFPIQCPLGITSCVTELPYATGSNLIAYFDGYIGHFVFRANSANEAVVMERQWISYVGKDGLDFVGDVDILIPNGASAADHRAVFGATLYDYNSDDVTGYNPLIYTDALASPYQGNDNAEPDAYLLEYTQNCTQVLRTSLGNADFDRCNAIHVMPDNRVAITGLVIQQRDITGQPIPTTFVGYTNPPGSSTLVQVPGTVTNGSAYVAVVSTDRDEIEWVRILGGAFRTDTYQRPCISSDQQGNIWVAAHTLSPEMNAGIVVNNSFLGGQQYFEDKNASGSSPTSNRDGYPSDGLIVCLDPDAEGAILYGTFYGGTGQDYPAGLCIAPQEAPGSIGEVYVVGYTTSACRPGVPGQENVAIPTVRQNNTPNGFFNQFFNGGLLGFIPNSYLDGNQGPFNTYGDGFLFRFSATKTGIIVPPCYIPPPLPPEILECLPFCE